LLQESIAIQPNETFDSLHDRLSLLSADLLTKTLEKMSEGHLELTEQDHTLASHAPMLEKQQKWIDFTKPASQIHDWIRALDPKPAAQCLMPNGKTIKLFSSVEILEYQDTPGKLLAANSEGLFIACGEGAIRVEELQLPNKKRISVKQYLAGNQFPEEFYFGSPTSPKK